MEQTSSPTTIAASDSIEPKISTKSNKVGFQDDMKREINSLFKFGSEFAAFSYDILQDATASAVVAVSDTVDAVVETQNRMTLNSVVDNIVNQLDLKISNFNNKSGKEEEEEEEEESVRPLNEVFKKWTDEAFQDYDRNAAANGVSISHGRQNEQSQYSIRRRILSRAVEKRRQSFVCKINESIDENVKNEDFEVIIRDSQQLSVDIKAQLENLRNSLPMNKDILSSEFERLLKSCTGNELEQIIKTKEKEMMMINNEKVLEILQNTSISYGYNSATFCLDVIEDDAVLVR